MLSLQQQEIFDENNIVVPSDTGFSVTFSSKTTLVSHPYVYNSVCKLYDLTKCKVAIS